MSDDVDVKIIDGDDLKSFLRKPLMPAEFVTEGEPWVGTRIGLLNAIIDTLEPGTRIGMKLEIESGKEESCELILMRGHPFEPRSRHIPTVLRELADQIEHVDQPIGKAL